MTALSNTVIISRTAFCCVRPPGHHAERNRAMGFCYLNNVGIGAKYAQFKYGLARVAVIDFDVHHGNGKHNH
jgi:acetoin utilization deacetylase AcuC-like enzyme